MTRAGWRWAAWLVTASAALHTGCFDTHGRGADAHVEAPDAAAFDGSLGPACGTVTPPCLRVESEAFTPDADDGFLVCDLAYDEGRLFVVTGEREASESRLAVRSVEADGSLSLVDAQDTRVIPWYATLAPSTEGLRFYWWQGVALRESPVALMEATVTDPRPSTLTTLPVADTLWAPSVTPSGAAWVPVAGALQRIRDGEVTSFEVPEVVRGRAVAVEASGDVTHVLWQRVDGSRLDAYVSTIEGDTLVRTEQVLVGIAAWATMIAQGDDLWVAAFTYTLDDLTGSHARIARLSSRDLTRVEPDRALYGWGGILPIDLRLISMPTSPGGAPVPWLVVLTGDARFGSGLALHARPLVEEPCRAAVELPLVTYGRDGSGERVTSMALTMHPDGLGFVVGHDTPGGILLHDVTLCEP